MSDQGAPAPDVAGPTGTPGTVEPSQAEVDWQKRYGDLQPEYTRATQRVAELERQQELYDLLISTDDPDTRREIAERLGYTLEEPEQPAELEDDPLVGYDQRLSRLETTLTEREQAEADEQYASQLRVQIDQTLDSLPGLDKDDQDWVLAYAINALPATPDGLPDIEQAHRVFIDRENARQRKWAEGKRSAPHIAPNGQAATEVPNLDNRQERVDWMVRRAQENEQAGY